MSDKQRWELRAFRGRECRERWFVRGCRAFAYSRAAARLAHDRFDDMGDGWTRVEVHFVRPDPEYHDTHYEHDGVVRVSVDNSQRALP